MIRRDRGLALGLSACLAALTLLPYLLAAYLTPQGTQFAGFLVNPIDGFSYLAKMREGAAGSWLFTLAYSPAPGPGAFIFTYYLLLGHLSAWTHISPLIVYHGARVAAAVVMFLVTYLLFERLLPDRWTRWAAFVIVGVGSGLGWIMIPSGVVASDLWIPESIPFLTAYANPHFPLAAAGLVSAIAVVGFGETLRWRRWPLAALAGVTIGIVLPFVAITMAAVTGAWLLWETLAAIRAGRWQQSRAQATGKWLAWGCAGLGMLPWVAYDAWLVRAQPMLATWNAQNLTPSPPVQEYLIGFGLILILAVAGVFMGRPYRSEEGRLMLTWLVVTAILVYLPFGMQRRLTLGLFVPMAGLAAIAVREIGSRRFGATRLLAVVLVLSLPSNLMVVGAGVAGVARGDPAVTLTASEAVVYGWIGENAPADSLVLAGPPAGNRLPAYARVRVVYGHPFETPHADAARGEISRLYRPPSTVDELVKLGAAYALYGPEERSLGSPAWLTAFPVVFRSDDIEVYRVAVP